MDVVITVGGTQWDFYDVVITRKLMDIGEAEFTTYTRPNLGDEVVITIDSTTVFRGYVRGVEKGSGGEFRVTVPEKTIVLEERTVYQPVELVNKDLATAVKEVLSENLDGNVPYIISPGTLPTGVTVSGLRTIGSRLEVLNNILKLKSSGKSSGQYEWGYDPANDVLNVADFIGSETSIGTYTEGVEITRLNIRPTETLYNRVIVISNADGNYAVLATAEDTASQQTYGVREKVIKTSKALTEAEAQEIANAYLNLYVNPPISGAAEFFAQFLNITPGDVATIVDEYGNTYTVRVGSVTWKAGAEEYTRIRFRSFGGSAEDVVRVLRTIQSDYTQPKGAPNVFHQTKSDNFDDAHPVVWRVHIPDDLDKTVSIQLSYKVSDFKAYAGSGSTSSYSGSTASAGGTGDTDSYNGTTGNIVVSGDTDIPSIGTTPGVASSSTFTNNTLSADTWTNTMGITLPTTYSDYGYVGWAFTVRATGISTGAGNTPSVDVDAAIYNATRGIYIPSSTSSGWYFRGETSPGTSGDYIVLAVQGFAGITYPKSWAGDTLYLRIKASVANLTSPALYYSGQGTAVGFGKHYHYFTDTTNTTYSVPALNVTLDPQKHGFSVPSLSVTNTSGIATATASGTFYIKVDGTQIYSDTVTENTIDVTTQLTPGWHTIEFGTSTAGGKGFVDMVVEAKGRLKTF